MSSEKRQRIGVYEIEGEAGRGGMATVLKGHHPVLERPVAIKRLLVPAAGGPELARFLAEARIMASLSHPNLVQVYDLIQEQGVYHLVMEWVDGESLRALIDAGPIPVAVTARVMDGLLAGLGHAHRHAVIHRDVKPENVLLTADGGVKLADFGIARLADSARAGLTESDQTLGTPAYMSPEQVTSSRVDHRSDLYSAAVVLHELAAGRTPFAAAEREGPLAVLTRLLTAEAPIAEELEPPLRAVLVRGLARAPETRFQSAEEFAAALRQEGPGSPATPAEPAARAAPSQALWRAGNLPEQLTSFIGREREMAEIRSLLQESRLVTMTGAGGIGKTRLALEVARLVSDSHPDGTWLVELAPVSDREQVTQAVAAALGVAEEKETPLLETLSRHLQQRTLLLVLDNCEHVLEASANLAGSLLKRCAGLRLLATSRERLGVAGEQAWPAPGLQLDDAVRLFEMRARAARPGFVLDASSRPDVEEVCRRMDGIPLAIELAAAQIRHLAPHQLLERLEDRFRVDAGARAGGGRHQTLRAAVEWSYVLLEPDEKTLFDRLSTFAIGFRLEDAESVASGDGIEAAAVLDLLIRLVDKSLLLVDAAPDTARYRQLETLRQYGGERLGTAGLAEEFGRRHAGHFTELAEAGEKRLRGAEQETALGEMSLALDNVGAALVWSRRYDPDLGLRLAAAMAFFWIIRSRFSEARAWVEEMLQATGPDSPHRVRGLGALGRVAHHQGDLVAARSAYSEAIELARRRGEDSVAAGTLVNLANIAEEQGDYAGARAGFEESLAFFRAGNNRYGVGVVTNNLGNLLFDQGDVGAARPLLEESLAVRRELGDLYGAATSLSNLAYVWLELGDLERARRLAEESLELRRRIEDRSGEAIAREALAEIALREGRLAEARGLLADVLAVGRQLDQRSRIAFTLEAFAELLVREGDGTRALTLLGAAATLREATEAAVPAVYKPRLERITREARELAGDEAEPALAAGRRLDLDGAVDLALG